LVLTSKYTTSKRFPRQASSAMNRLCTQVQEGTNSETNQHHIRDCLDWDI